MSGIVNVFVKEKTKKEVDYPYHGGYALNEKGLRVRHDDLGPDEYPKRTIDKDRFDDLVSRGYTEETIRKMYKLGFTLNPPSTPPQPDV